MEIGEFTSTCLSKLIRQEKYMRRKFGSYCRQHKKTLTVQYFLGEEKHILKFNLILKHGNIGEAGNSKRNNCN